MHATDERGDVDVDDVSVLDHPRIRDAVADDLVDAGTQRLRESAITQRRWVGIVVAQELVADPIEFVRGDAGGHVRPDEFTCLRSQSASDPHLLDGFAVLHLRTCVRRRRRLIDVLGARNVGWHRAARRDLGRLDSS